MRYFKVMYFAALVLPVTFVMGCAMGNARQSAYERALFAAQAKIDLERTAHSTEQIISRYESYYTRGQYEKLENQFAEMAVTLAGADIPEDRLARLIAQTYRQYGEQRGRLERELVADQAKGNQIINNIIKGGDNIEALQLAEDVESAAEIKYSEFVGDLILRSGERLVFEAENLAAQRSADKALERRLELLERAYDVPEEEPVEEPVELPEMPEE